MRQIWSAQEEECLRSHYADTSTVDLARQLGRTVSKITAKAKQMGIRKSERYLNDPANRCRLLRGTGIGTRNRFPKNHVPVNKGLRRPGWSVGRMKETQFQKGERSGAAAQNWMPIGTIAADSGGYLRIKLRDAVHGKEATGYGNTDVWPLYHRYLWEQAHGPIQENHIITFKDKDRTNCTLENLECISLAQNAERNRMWNIYPRELADVIQLNGVLKRKLRESNAQEK